MVVNINLIEDAIIDYLLKHGLSISDFGVLNNKAKVKDISVLNLAEHIYKYLLVYTKKVKGGENDKSRI